MGKGLFCCEYWKCNRCHGRLKGEGFARVARENRHIDRKSILIHKKGHRSDRVGAMLLRYAFLSQVVLTIGKIYLKKVVRYVIKCIGKVSTRGDE